MSTALNLFEQLLARGRQLQCAGFTREATRLFQRLTKFRVLPNAVAEEVQKRLGEIRLQRGQFAKARRHFAAALGWHPGQADYHHLMAAATQGDDDADPQRALDHFRRAVDLEPTNPRYLCDLGLQAVALGEIDEGLEALGKAVELAPDEPEVLEAMAVGLREADRLEEARRLLRSARFRHPRDGRFQKLWNDFQFQTLHDQQQAARRRVELTHEEPAILPFVRRESPRLVRNDCPSTPTGPHQRRHSRRP